MQEYKRDFIEFMVRSDVLTFGDFTTKSGRQTPFFINTGRYRTGEQLAQLGAFYAAAIDESWPDDVDILFGPAYKGIPLVATASIGLAARGRNIGYLFNRKEAKDHGEGGVLVGALPADGDRVLIVEDVTTAGTSIRETVPILRAAADVRLAGLVVSVDRQERRDEAATSSALEELSIEFDMPVAAIVDLDGILEHLGDRLGADDRSRIDAYRARHGVPTRS